MAGLRLLADKSALWKNGAYQVAVFAVVLVLAMVHGAPLVASGQASKEDAALLALAWATFLPAVLSGLACMRHDGSPSRSNRRLLLASIVVLVLVPLAASALCAFTVGNMSYLGLAVFAAVVAALNFSKLHSFEHPDEIPSDTVLRAIKLDSPQKQKGEKTSKETLKKTATKTGKKPGKTQSAE